MLEKVLAGESLSDADKDIYEAGLVGVLRELHAQLDAAVAEAYGWPKDLPDAAILERLVALNHERAAMEAKGQVHWLRPEFQAPREAAKGRKAEQMEADLGLPIADGKKQRLPADLPSQVSFIRAALASASAPLTAGDLSRKFAQGRRVEAKVEEVLRTLALLGQAERTTKGYLLTTR